MSETITNVRLSHSGLEKLSCPRKWKFYYLDERKDEDKPGPAAAVGTFCHSCLEDLYGLPRAERTLDKLRSIAVARWFEFSDYYAEQFNDGFGVDELEANELKALIWQGLEGAFLLEDPTEVEVHSVEYELNVHYDGLEFVGYVDRIDYLPSGGLKIIDYKAGKVPKEKFVSSKLIQLALYAWALGELGIEVDRAELHYITYGVIVGIDIDEVAMLKATKHLETSVRNIETYMTTGEYPPNPQMLCGWCPFVLDCPEGEEFIRNMRTYGRMRADAPGWEAIQDRDRHSAGGDEHIISMMMQVEDPFGVSDYHE